MSRDALLALVRERIGLDPATLGERVLDDACAEARIRFGLADDAALYRRVLLDADAFADCIESFTVPESWFFRAGEQFADLARFARAHPHRRPLRVLCLPSAAGEEAWSAAITLVEAGLQPGEFDILGIDVSRAAVRRAQDGVYRRSAFRGQPPPPEWLHPTGDGHFRVDPMLRRGVRFRVGNALDPLLLQSEAAFDAVFCRNLLIYLHAAARRQLLQTLVCRLTPPGLLLAGQAEVLSGLDERLLPWPDGSPLTFVFTGEARPRPRPEPTIAELPLWEGLQARAAASLKTLPRARAQAQGAAAAAGSATAPTTAAPGPKVLPLAQASAAAATSRPPEADAAADPVAAAHRLADAGRVAEARAACLAHLAVRADDVAALYLLGLLESAAGDAEAADRAFNQVLYLDRDHLEALEQRIGLAERRGASAQAVELRARAARLRQRLAQAGIRP